MNAKSPLVSRDNVEKFTLVVTGWNLNCHHHSGNHFAISGKSEEVKLHPINVPIPLRSVYPEETLARVNKARCTIMFIEALIVNTTQRNGAIVEERRNWCRHSQQTRRQLNKVDLHAVKRDVQSRRGEMGRRL